MNAFVLVSIISVLSLLSISPVFATTEVSISNITESSSQVNVQTSTGQSTVCINGTCTTSSKQGSSTTTVCINGTCTTSRGGIIAHEGHVHEEVSKTPEQTRTEKVVGKEVKAAQKTVDEKKKEVEKKVQGEKEKVDAKKKELEEKAKNFSLFRFVEAKIKSLFAPLFN